MKHVLASITVLFSALFISGCNPVSISNSAYNQLRYQILKSNSIKCINMHDTIRIFNTNHDLAQRFELEIAQSGCLQLIDKAANYSFSATITGPEGWETLDIRFFKNQKIIDIQKYRCNGEIHICVVAATNDILKSIIPPHIANK